MPVMFADGMRSPVPHNFVKIFGVNSKSHLPEGSENSCFLIQELLG